MNVMKQTYMDAEPKIRNRNTYAIRFFQPGGYPYDTPWFLATNGALHRAIPTCFAPYYYRLSRKGQFRTIWNWIRTCMSNPPKEITVPRWD